MFKDKVPSGTDILLTHGPPKYHLDSIYKKGCDHLLREIWRARQSLKLVVFGHIHEGHGTEILSFDQVQKTYERFLLNEGGPLTFVLLAFWVLWTYVGYVVGFARRQRGRDARGVRLVNAAIACGSGNTESRVPLVYQI